MKTTDMTEMKTELLRQCKENVRSQLEHAKRAMDEAQREANSHKGAMASRYDTFKEEAQALRDGFAMQVQDFGDALALLDRISPDACHQICVGSVLRIEQDGEPRTIFVSTGLVSKPLTFEGEEITAAAFGSPLVRALRNARVGQTISLPQASSGPFYPGIDRPDQTRHIRLIGVF